MKSLMTSFVIHTGPNFLNLDKDEVQFRNTLIKIEGENIDDLFLKYLRNAGATFLKSQYTEDIFLEKLKEFTSKLKELFKNNNCGT